MAGPPVDKYGLFELSIDPCWNSLDTSFKSQALQYICMNLSILIVNM